MAKRQTRTQSRTSRRKAARVTAVRRARSAALHTWKHLSPAKRKGKTRDSFVARSTAARIAATKPRTTTKIPTTRKAKKTAPRSLQPSSVEYIGAADYRASRRSSSVSIQISARGPANASAADAQDAVRTKIKTGSSPRGWTVRLIDWPRSPDAWTRLRGPLRSASLTDFKPH